jgi:DNA-directed RNA polymerase specialized sigma24 family protein
VEPARFAELFDRHYPAILRYLRRRIGPDLADNLAAETFTLAFRRRHQYRAEHPDAAAWLYGIAGNLLRQHARTEVRRLRASAGWCPTRSGPTSVTASPSGSTPPPPHVAPRWPWPTSRPSSARCCCCRVLDLDGTRGGQWDNGKVRDAGLGW